MFVLPVVDCPNGVVVVGVVVLAPKMEVPAAGLPNIEVDVDIGADMTVVL